MGTVSVQYNVVIRFGIRVQQGGHGTGKTGNLVLTFSRQGKHREFCSDTGKNLLTQENIWTVIINIKSMFIFFKLENFLASLCSA